MRQINKKFITLGILSFCQILILVLIHYLSTLPLVIIVNENFQLPSSALIGTVQYLLLAICFIMVIFDYNYGSKLSYLFMLICVATILYHGHHMKSFSFIPGLISIFLGAFCMNLISRYNKKRAIMAVTDYVTGLKNSRQFGMDLKELVEEGSKFYLCYFEVKDFKLVNEQFGMKAGDFILQKMAMNISSVIEKNEVLYKISGSIFALLTKNIYTIEKKIQKIIGAGEKPTVIPADLNENSSVSNECNFKFVCGVVLCEKNRYTEKDILTNVDIALTNARHDKEKKYSLYDDSMKDSTRQRIEMEKFIDEALDNNYFYFVYQPQFELKEKKLRGFETLIRCRKPDGSMVFPNQFIPIAEKSNLILKIDDYVLKNAMKEMKPYVVNAKDKFVVSLNVSAKNICLPEFADKVLKIVEETEFPPDCLEIEITEYSLGESQEITVANINKLRQKGIQIALDDFGTGYTSISQLLNLPVNLLKVDKSLVDRIVDNPKNLDLVDSVIYMGHIMNCEVISEGVEDENQLKVLKDHNCDFVQGYVWGKPVEMSDASKLIV